MKKLSKLFILTLPFWAPLYLVKINIGIPTNLLDLLIFVALLLEILFLFEKKDVAKLHALKKYFWPFTLISAGLFISTFQNADLLSGLGIIKGWFFFPILAGILIYLNSDTGQRTSDKEHGTRDLEKRRNPLCLVTCHLSLNSYFFSAVIVSAIAFGALLAGDLTFDGRLKSFYLSPNMLAMYIAPAFIGQFLIFNLAFRQAGFQFLNKSQSQISKKINLLILACLTVALYCTYSYAAWIAIAGSVSIALLLSFRPKQMNEMSERSGGIFFLLAQNDKKIISREALISIYFGAAIFLFLVFSQLTNPKLQNLLNPTNHSSLSSRLAIWKSAGYILKDNFFFGIGPSNFQQKYLEYQKYFPPYPEWAVPHPHNVFLTFWLSSGLLGMAGFVWLLINWLTNVIKICHPELVSGSQTNTTNLIQYTQEKKREHNLHIILFAIMLYFLLHGLVDTTILKNDLALIFWMIFFLGL